MTLIFWVEPDIIQIHPHTKFRDPGPNGLAVRVLKTLSVGALKERKKQERNKLGEKKAVLCTGLNMKLEMRKL